MTRQLEDIQRAAADPGRSIGVVVVTLVARRFLGLDDLQVRTLATYLYAL
jgi:hypothetical protein